MTVLCNACCIFCRHWGCREPQVTCAGNVLYNSINLSAPVGLSPYPVRQLLDPYLASSFVAEFHAALFQGVRPPPPTPVPFPAVLQVWDLYATSGRGLLCLSS